MGKPFFDISSFYHFGMGTISYVLLTKINIPLVYNFLLSNGFHLFIELIENNKKPNGEILETSINHIGDILLFLIGWILGYLIQIQKYTPDVVIPFLWVLLILTAFAEICREIYPNRQILFVKGSFIK